MSATANITCPLCRTATAETFVVAEAVWKPCPTCGQRYGAWVWPALFRENAPTLVRAAEAGADDATCFFHPGKTAAVPCAACGRFLCPLCDAEIDGRHICPSCLDTATLSRAWIGATGGRVRYDMIALSLAIVPLLVFPFTVFSAPATVYLVLRHWRSPISLVPRSRVWFVVALVLGVIEIGLWLTLAWHLWFR